MLYLVNINVKLPDAAQPDDGVCIARAVSFKTANS